MIAWPGTDVHIKEIVSGIYVARQIQLITQQGLKMVTVLWGLVSGPQKRAHAAVCNSGRAEVMVTDRVTSFSVA